MPRSAGLFKQVITALIAVGLVYVAFIFLVGLPGPSVNPRGGIPDSVPTARDDWRYPPRAGIVSNSATGTRVVDEQVRKELLKHEPASRTYAFRNRSDNALAFVAAPAVDGTFHPPQVFLLGQVPYRVEQAWMPLFALSERMRYQLDKHQFQGREEVWLTTLQAWSRAKGDCEDHAIPLADWLIEMGLDARVVLGKHRREGHAWVVVFKDGQEYLLEATHKKKVKRWSAYPLARLLPDYHPEMMFNRQTLWINTGSSLTVNYTGPKWRPALSLGPA